MALKPAVAEALVRHGIVPAPAETPAALRERLTARYLEDIRRLKARHHEGEIALADYGARVEALKNSYPLLALPLELWSE